MRKTPEQIQDDKLASNQRKSAARRDQAQQAVQDAKASKDAHTRRGQQEIARRSKAARKAAQSAARHEKEQLAHEVRKSLGGRVLPSKKPVVL